MRGGTKLGIMTGYLPTTGTNTGRTNERNKTSWLKGVMYTGARAQYLLKRNFTIKKTQLHIINLNWIYNYMNAIDNFTKRKINAYFFKQTLDKICLRL